MSTTRRAALRTTRPRSSRAARPGRRSTRIGLDGVLADLDRDAAPTAVPGEAAGDGFTWDAADRDDPAWWPQGVASLDEAGDVLLVSWYAKRRGRCSASPGARISVVDRRDRERPRYRHVLLAAPRAWPLRPFGAVPVHAGGIAVVGDLLHVADTIAGVRVFRLSDVLRVPRRSLGRRLARGAPAGEDDVLVLPQRQRLRVPLLTGTGRLRFSFVSVGEVAGQLSLVAGEYRRSGGAPRLVRYPLDPATGLPLPGARGRCAPVEVHEHAPPRMQGAAVHGSTWYVSASAGEGNPGDLHVGAPGALRRHRGVLPPGPEDLSWSRPGQELWCLSEWPGHRCVFPVDAARWTASTGTGRPTEFTRG